jgi:DNA primase catalytic core
MRFPPSFIERLRSHFLLSEIIGRRMPVKKHGREYQGLCPFHNEKSPSFTINDAKGFFHCFGCGAHGDAIEFIRRYERLSYPETIERLAREAGIPLPQLTQEESRKVEAQKTLYDAVEAACMWFEKQLVETVGTTARDYLEKRGLKAETLRQFRIGFAPDDRAALHQHLLKAGFSQTLQAEAGLIIVPDSGSPYDRFRGRVMFPIRNTSGRVIAFGGRLMGISANKNLPKYLNSPETALFKKGELLFNLDMAKKHVREGGMAVVMEGYMDVVSAAQSGVTYAVATLGTAVTPEHLRLLWQLVKEPAMCLDGDAAGMRAMMRAADVALPLLKPGYGLRFATLPKGEDPDSFIQKNGKASFEKIIATARRLSDVVWDKLLAEQSGSVDSAEALAALKSACDACAAKILDPTVRNSYAQHFERNHYACNRALWKKLRVNPKITQATSPQVMQLAFQPHSVALETLVRRMLSLLIKFPQMLHKSQVEEALVHLDIHRPDLEALRQSLMVAIEFFPPPAGGRPGGGHTSSGEQDSSHPNPPPEGEGAFVAWLEARMHGEVLASLLNGAFKLPYSDALTLEDATLLWGETVSVYNIVHLEFELQSLQEKAAQTMDEAIYTQMAEVKQALWKAQGKRTFAPAETDEA